MSIFNAGSGLYTRYLIDFNRFKFNRISHQIRCIQLIAHVANKSLAIFDLIIIFKIAKLLLAKRHVKSTISRIEQIYP